MPGGLVLGEDEILVETTFRTFLVRVDRFRQTPLTEAQREDGRRLASELRFGLGFDPDLQVAAQRLQYALLDAGRVRLRRPDSTLETPRFFEQLRDFLEEQLESGRLIVLEEPAIANVPEQELTVRLPRLDAQPPERLLPRRDAPLETSFEVRYVDEIGQAISGLDVEIAADDRRERVTTNAAGVALLEGTTAGSGTVAVLDAAALDQILEPRWAKKRSGTAPGGLNRTEQLFDGQNLDVTDIKAGVPNTVIIKPKLGKLFVELWDKAGRVRHANRDYTISGPVSLEGTTDADGRLLHEDVLAGDYALTLTLVHFEGDPDEVTDTVQSALVVLDASDGQPQVRLVGAVPRSVMASLHMFFNTNKTFLLPTALPSVKKLRQVYAQNRPSQLLVVGHADTAGDAAYNDKLSLERAEATVAFLKDDVDTWLKNYGMSVDSKKRWGKVEDHLMIISMPDFDTKPKGDDAVKWYQSTRGLTVDGSAGTETRTKLIKEYMSLDGASLEDPSLDDTSLDDTSPDGASPGNTTPDGTSTGADAA
jgi:outer membrane protein OmpA-like peptidoglycan-associated protein